mmetsp:Transcript_131064/g.261493  ORF Transcript_131064/g.261493 Transcript_131064/m.261493 type:complete len:108 (-) Transcript_131064:140-463(-)
MAGEAPAISSADSTAAEAPVAETVALEGPPPREETPISASPPPRWVHTRSVQLLSQLLSELLSPGPVLVCLCSVFHGLQCACMCGMPLLDWTFCYDVVGRCYVQTCL